MYRADVGVDALLPDVPVPAVGWLLVEILDAPPALTAPVRDVLPTLLVVSIVVPIARPLRDRV